jgi:hypothetical protein
MSITELLKSNPELAGNIVINTNVSDLQEFANFCIEKGKETRQAPEPEKYLTAQEFADKLNVSLVTLWSWDRKGITNPVRIGATKRYKLSDLKKMLQEV